MNLDNIMLDQQRLIFNGKQLDEDITVAQATLSINSTIHLLLCLILNETQRYCCTFKFT